MDLISQLLPSQAELSLQYWELDTATQQVTVYLASAQTAAHFTSLSSPESPYPLVFVPTS